MRLYKFLNRQFALKSMRERRLKVSRLMELNDPFEMFSVDSSNTAHGLALAEMLYTMNMRTGIICFSKTWLNPVMWTHYADDSRGMCLGFDIPDHLAKQIDYSERRAPFADLGSLEPDKQLDAMTRILFTKFADWHYEEEYRLSVRLDWSAISDRLFFKEWDDDLKLVEVVVGLRCHACRRELEGALQGYGEKVAFVHARASADSFALVQRDHDHVYNHDDLIYFLRRGDTLHPTRFVRDLAPMA